MKYSIVWGLVFIAGLSGCVTNGKKSAQTVEPVQSAKAIQSAPQHTGTGTLIIKPIGFRNGAYIREAVKRECNLDGKLTQFIDQFAAGQYANIETNSTASSANAQVLTVEIEEVQGGGGGAWSGAKSVVIKGLLTQNGRTLGDFKARRYSGGGMFGAYKGTCAILGRCVKTLGKDVAGWLTHPTPQAALGDL